MDSSYRRNLAISLGGMGAPMLRRGARGEDVAALQEFLLNRGYAVGKVDGKFGPKTEEAVRQFQLETGVMVDGRVGDETRGAMERVAQAPVPEMRPDMPEPVDPVADADMMPDNGGIEPEPVNAPSFDDEMFTEAKPDLGAQYSQGAAGSDWLAGQIDAVRSNMSGIPKSHLAASRHFQVPDDWAARPGDGQDELRAALLRSIMNRQGMPVAGY